MLWLLFWIALFQAVLIGSIADCLAWLISFWLYLLLKFLLIFFTNISTHLLNKRQKSIAFYKYSISWLKWIPCHFLHVILKLKTKVKHILSSIYRRLEFWSVNHTSIYENYESKVFKNIKFGGEIFNNWPNDLLGTNIYDS